MEYFLLKLKDSDLFFNSDSECGHFTHPIPMLFDVEGQVDELFEMGVTVYSHNDIEYSIHAFEKKKVKLTFV